MTMRELSETETQQVSGGIAPLIGLAVAVVSHAGARTAVQDAASRIGSAMAVYAAANYFGGT